MLDTIGVGTLVTVYAGIGVVLVAFLIVTSAWALVLWLLQRRRYARMTKRLERAERRQFRRTRWQSEQ